MRFDVQVLSPEGRYLGTVSEIEARDADEAEASVRESLNLDPQVLERTWSVKVTGFYTFEFDYEDTNGDFEDVTAVEQAVVDGSIDPADYGFEPEGLGDVSIDDVTAYEQ